MDIIWKGSPNFWHGNDGRVAVVNHTMAGSLSATDGWFKNKKSEASSHFGVGYEGQIHQYVNMNDSSWCNGPVHKPDLSLDWVYWGNPNKSTISIEHEGIGGKPLTEKQYQATLWLHRYILKQFPSIKVDRQHIVGHYQIDSVNKWMCPGSAFPFERLMHDLLEGEQLWDNDNTASIEANGLYVIKRFANWYYNNDGWNTLGNPTTGMSGEFEFGYWTQDFQNGRLKVKEGGNGEIIYVPINELFDVNYKGE
jgi:very-short-patch-repair endonuclease